MISNGLKPSAASTTPTISERIASLSRTSAGLPPKNRSICPLSLSPARRVTRQRLAELRLELRQNWCEGERRSSGTRMRASKSLIVETPLSGAARAVRRLVQGARLAPPRPPAGAAGACRGGARHAADRADRRRQDAGRLPAEPDRSRAAARSRKPETAIHTLYVSPLKALAVDVARNLVTPVGEMGLPIRLETRTGDTPPSRRARQRVLPARHSADDAGAARAAAVASRRGRAVRRPQIRRSSTSCTRSPPASAAICWRSTWRGSRTLAPELTAIGLSATVARPYELARLSRAASGAGGDAAGRDRHGGRGRRRADIAILEIRGRAALGRAFGALCACPRSTRRSRRTA